MKRTSKEVKTLVKQLIDNAIKAHGNKEITDEELLSILRPASTMIPESIMQYETCEYTANLYEDWDITDFSLWYGYTFTSENF